MTAGPASAATTTTAPSVSSASNANGRNALLDGAVARGGTGAEWFAAAADAKPWAQLSFSSARKVSSVQIFGPTANWVNPAGTANAPLYGRLLFSNGSSVIVSGIAGGANSPTTVAFSARSVTWVRLELLKTDPQVKFGLREFVAYDAGTTPPRWPTNPAPGYAAPYVPAGTCAANSAPFGSSDDGSPALVCPRPGTLVNGTATIVVSARPGTALTASAWLPLANAGAGGVATVGSAVATASGRAKFSINATRLTLGPTAVRFTTGSTSDRPLYVQLDNARGLPRPTSGSAPSGMTLQWSDDFMAPISVTQSGAGADYAATKPALWGGSEFGDAIFANPAWGLNTIATVDSNFLRIRAQPTTMADPNGWGRTHVAGMVSSLKVGATGFSAQYGFFEARILAPAGYGSWPAFWLMNSENAANREVAASEVDTVELYGQFPAGSCHSLHAWNAPGNSEAKCLSPNGSSDWALSWHTYAAWVKSDRVDYYIDNRLVATILHPILTEEPFYFMLDQSLGGGWPIKLAGTGDTIDLYVDWVRVYT